VVTFDEKKQEEQLEVIKKREQEDLARILSEKYKIPYVNLFRASIDLEALNTISEQIAKENGVAIIRRKGRILDIAVKNPTLPHTKSFLTELRKNGYSFNLYLSSPAGLQHTWERYREITKGTETFEGMIVIGKSQMAELGERLKIFDNVAELLRDLIAKGPRMNTTELLQLILASGLKLGASDVHIEPSEETVTMRLRLDGMLHNITSFKHELYKLLLSRIKLLSGLKLNVRDSAQDGRFTIRAADEDIEIRASTLPGPFGETTVLRLLNPKTISLSLEELGMQQPVYELLSKEIRKPNGMILTTGPTGSGKTTTLYAFIKKINSPQINIVTIENPVEYHIKGITQTQVDTNGKYTFETGLQSILRQDPDVILVGEIRNLETARTALHAALTGHLVFSTLHTNNAPATIPRLIDIGAKPNIIAPAINVAIAQRLIRHLCQQCKHQYAPSARDLDYAERILKGLPKPYKRPDLQHIKFWEADGCEACNMVGFKGRIGIFEVFAIDEKIEKLIFKNPSEAEVLDAARAQGMLTLHQDGILKAAEGITSVAELIRVAGEF